MERLKELQKQKCITQTKLAKLLGVATNTLSQYENNIRQMPDEIKKKCADYFNVSIDYLMNRDFIDTIKKNRIPVLGHIQAGIPIEMVEDIVDFEDIPEDWLKGEQTYFGLKVRGSSMYPKYAENDTIIVRKQDDCESGQDCVVSVNGDDATLKKVIKKRKRHCFTAT